MNYFLRQLQLPIFYIFLPVAAYIHLCSPYLLKKSL